MHLKPFIRVLMLIACLFSAAQAPLPAYGAEPIKLGVIDFPSKAQALAQWQPLTVILKQAMPARDFVVVALSHAELDQAVAARQLDFVLTNAGQYLLLRNRNGLSSPLATLASDATGQSLTVFGGVIFSRAGQADINTLSDIKGKTVAVVATESQGAYQVPAYELSRVGIRLPQDVKLITTGNPHDLIVEAVLAGRADVGFVRSGVLEGMVREGKLDINQLKILNPQNLPDFPFQVSTRLYPEWPFAAMPHIDEDLARHVAAVLFELDENKAATRTMGIHGFVVPADYSPVEDVLRELRMPPFEVAPRFTLQDVWARYRWQNVGALLAGGVILSLGVSVLFMYRRLAASHKAVLLHQQKLQEGEEKFRTVADYTYAWEIWEDPAGACLYCSPSCERVTGYSSEAFMADSGLLARLIHPEDLPLWKAHYDAVHDLTEAQKIAKGHANKLEFRILLPDGEVRWIGHLCYHVHDAEGHDLGHRISNRDITEEKQAVQALAEAELRFKAIFNAAVDGILVADAQSHALVMGNSASCDMLGYQLEELTRLGIEDIHPAEALPEVLRQIERQMKGEIRVAPDLPVQRKDGSVFFADVSTTPMVLAGGPLLVGVFHDITERKEVEEKIRKLNDELENKVRERTQQLLAAQEELVRKEKLAMLGQVAVSVGHELRNPLGVMSNAVYFLQTVLLDADETTKEYLNIIKDEIAGSECIVSVLLDAVRTKPPQPERVGVQELIEQTLGKYTVPSSVTVKLDIPETLPALRVDVGQIQQVFSNLISNGVEAMPEGGTLEIRAVADEAAKNITVSVRDSGTGIAPEMMAKLFQPLFTTKARGIGLGLVVVKNLIEANGGRVEVQSEPGKGTLFAITLPSDVSAVETA